MSVRILLLIAILGVHSADAGPWARGKGKGFLQLGFSTIGYSTVYGDDAVKRSAPGKIRDNVLQIFLDYGLTSDLTGSCTIPYKILSFSTDTGKTSSVTASGVGDILLSLKWTPWNSGGFVFASEIMAELPTGNASDVRGLYRGNGILTMTARLSVGTSFHPLPLFLSANIGYGFREQPFSNDVTYNLEAGYGLFENHLYLILLLSGRESTSTHPTLTAGSSPFDRLAAERGLYTNNQEFTAIIPKVLVKWDNGLGAVASYGTAVHGRNIAGGAVLAGSVFYEF